MNQINKLERKEITDYDVDPENESDFALTFQEVSPEKFNKDDTIEDESIDNFMDQVEMQASLSQERHSTPEEIFQKKSPQIKIDSSYGNRN